MNKKLQSFIALACATALSVTLFSGCGNEAVSDASNSSAASNSSSETETANTGPVEISLISADDGRIVKEDNSVVKEIEKRTNTKLSIQLVTGSEYTNKYNVMVAGGNIPDISKHTTFTFQPYAAQGIYLDVAPLLKKNAPNLMKVTKEDEFKLTQYDGKQYGIPIINKAGKFVSVIRQDWLEALGISKLPTTLEEYTEALRKITSGDPDKNGKNDTFGLSSPGGWSTNVLDDFDHILGAFGMQIDQFYIKEDKVYPSMISGEYKAALEYISKLWSEKLIDPEIFTMKGDQATQKMAANKVGSFSAWWSIAPQVVMNQLKMKDTVPTAKWEPFTLMGSDGKSGMRSMGNIYGTLCVSANTKNPEAVVKFADYLFSDEGYELAYYGIQGVHYTEPGQPRTADGLQGFDGKWLDIMSIFTNRPDLQFDLWPAKSTDPVKLNDLKYQQAGYNYNLYQDAFYGVPPTDEKNTLDADLKKYEMEYFIKFVTGAIPLSKWDEYVTNWNSKGGKKILDSMIKKYNELKGTSMTSGVQ